jgi:hypothetical protein
MYFTLGGVNSPGTIALGGVKGFKRQTGWDTKRGKGTLGATLTLTSVPPVKGSITLNLISDEDFANYDAFVSQVLSISPTQQQAEGLTLYYPAFASIGLTQVVVESYSSPEEQGGKRKYQVVIEFIEWQPPPATSVVSTPTQTAPNKPQPGPTPQDPRVAALQAQIAALSQANKAVSQK